VTFTGHAGFDEATFSGEAHFNGATFEQVRDFGPMLVGGRLVLDGVVFAQAVRIEVSARHVSCARTVFRAGADVFVRWAEVSLEDADFAEPSLVAELPAALDPGGAPGFLGWEEPAGDGIWRCRLGVAPTEFTPRVVSVRRAKVAKLTLSGVDLRACRFADAHGLDGLRLERVQFAQPPGRRVHWRRVRWTRRQTVAEEHHWRAKHGDGPAGTRASCEWTGCRRRPNRPSRSRSPESIERCARVARATRTSRVLPTSTTAKWRCAATPRAPRRDVAI
jgi:hypothetical protein